MCNDCGESKADLHHAPVVYPGGIKVHDVVKDGKPWKRITWRENGEPCEITIREGGPQSVEQIVKDIETRQKRRESKPGYYHSDDRDQT